MGGVGGREDKWEAWAAQANKGGQASRADRQAVGGLLDGRALVKCGGRSGSHHSAVVRKRALASTSLPCTARPSLAPGVDKL